MATYGYIWRSNDMEAGPQLRQLREAGVPDNCIFVDGESGKKTGTSTRSDWEKLDGRLQHGDKLIVASVDRLGRRNSDMVEILAQLFHRGVRVVTLAETEQFLCPYLNPQSGTREQVFAPVLVSFMELLADMDRKNLARKTQAGMKAAKAEGKRIGAPPKYNERTRAAIRADRAAGRSWGQIYKDWGTPKSTAQRIVAEGDPPEKSPAAPTPTVADGPHGEKTCAEAALESPDLKCTCDPTSVLHHPRWRGVTRPPLVETPERSIVRTLLLAKERGMRL